MIDSAASPPAVEGLSSTDVAERVAAGLTNRTTNHAERSFAQILRANVLTPVNGIMVTLFALIVLAGFWQDGLFVGVVISNSVIGITLEVLARRELTKLRVLGAPRAAVVRDGEVGEVAADDVVLDDIVVLRPGDQLVVDGEVLASEGLDVD
jgi:cation-transporting ATPase E